MAAAGQVVDEALTDEALCRRIARAALLAQVRRSFSADYSFQARDPRQGELIRDAWRTQLGNLGIEAVRLREGEL